MLYLDNKNMLIGKIILRL